MNYRSAHETEQSEGNPQSIKVLMYHRIVDDKKLCEEHWSRLHINRFKQQLELLERWKYTTVTFNDIHLFSQGKLNLPAKPVILTFDDGYLDTYTKAFPLMKQLGMKGVIFVLGDRKIRTNFWDAKYGFSETPLMMEEHIRELHRSGFEIGAHSMSHANLNLLSEDKAWREISHSRMNLEVTLNGVVRSFAYPYGFVTQATKRMVEQAGYVFACGVSSGPAVFIKDMYEIRRMTIFNNINTAGFAMRILTPYQHYAWLRSKIGSSLREMKSGNNSTNSMKVKQEKTRSLSWLHT